MPQLPEQFKPYWVPEKQVKQRETTTKTKFYQSMPWRKLRAVKIRMNPLCESCLKVNKIEKVKQVDHIKPINQADPFNTEGGRFGEALNMANLQSLCERCHNQKSAKESIKNKLKQ